MAALTRQQKESALQVTAVADLPSASLALKNGDLVQTQRHTVDGHGANLYVYRASGRSGVTLDLGWFLAGGKADDYFEAVDKSRANVLHFGAIPDGATDSTAAIQSANDAAKRQRAPLFFPGKSFLITDTITITVRRVTGEATHIDSGNQGTLILFAPAAPADLKPAFRLTAGMTLGGRFEYVSIWGPESYAPTVATLGAYVTPGALPASSAFAAGPVGVEVTGTSQPTFTGVATRRVKVGLLLNSTSGHVKSYESNWYGLWGVYCKKNTEDYFFQGGSIQGAWSAVVYGNTLQSGHYGGMNIYAQRTNIGFSPFAFYQVRDDPANTTNASSLYGTLLGCRFEKIGEAVIQDLPESVFERLFVDTWNHSWSDLYTGYPADPGDPWVTNLPPEFVPYANQQSFALHLGKSQKNFSLGVESLSLLKSTATSADPAGVVEFQQHFGNNSIGINQIDPTEIRVVGTKYPSAPTTGARGPAAGRYDLAARPSNNLIKDPEVLANWSKASGATAALVLTDWATEVAAANASWNMPLELIADLGTNPTLLKFTTGAGDFFSYQITPPVAPVPNVANSRYFLAYWAWANGRWLTRTWNGGSSYQFNQAYGQTGAVSGWSKIVGFDGKFQNEGMRAVQVNASTDPALTTLYVAGLMYTRGGLARYNRYAVDRLDGLAIDNITTGTAAPSAGGAGALPATPLGYMTIRLNGTSVRVPYY